MIGGELVDEATEKLVVSGKVDDIHLGAFVSLVDAMVVVVPENRPGCALPSVVEGVLDAVRKPLRSRYTEHADADDMIPEVTPAVTNDRDGIGRRFISHLLVLPPSY
jgi:hypothetical protein